MYWSFIVKASQEPSEFLTNAIGFGLAVTDTPSKPYAVVSDFPLTAGMSAEKLAERERAMIGDRMIFDTSKIKLDQASIRAFLEKHIPISAELWDTVSDVFGLDDIPSLSEEFAGVAERHPQFIRQLIAGKLSSAIHLIPKAGKLQEDMSEFSVDEERYLLEVVFTAASCHQLISLCRAGETAWKRCYRPTGIDVLDKQAGRRSTTVHRVAGTIAWNARWIKNVLDLYDTAKIRPLTAQEEKAILSEPGLYEDAVKLEKVLQDALGSQASAFADECHRLAKRYTKHILFRAQLEKKAHSVNATMYKRQGLDPLVIFWLACSHAWAWRKTGTDDLRPNALQLAITAIRDGKPFAAPPRPTQALLGARQIFFLIRNTVARDPKSVGFNGAGSFTADITKIALGWQREMMKDASRGEAFSASLTGDGDRIYDRAVEAGDRWFLEEVHGPLLTQLHL